ncbi:sulfatase [Salinigranum halophilum]|uniref:sulfatase n=1 Tax=Salinigranum halophilum TaxID=2565931 RepID=UPI0010A76578|nr:sulfatase [Salinigranum halophilum]
MGTPNIVLLTVDALRADHCSGLGYHRDTTLGLDAFASEAIAFHECVSVSSHTREAMPPLLSGYRPAEFAANGFRATDDPLLAERLSDAGYVTGGFHSNPYLSRAYDFDRGFDEFYDDLLLGQNRILALAQRALEKFVFKRGEYYARADEINRRSLDWLDSVGDDRPVFLWNHYMDAHGPYHSPERHWADKSLSASEAESLYRRSWTDPESITDDEQRLLVDSYDDEIRWLDGQITQFFDALRDRDLFEESLVILTADHGDAFGEHGYYTHPRYLHDILLRVPLVVSLPGGTQGSVDEQVSTLDVVPTVTAHAGVDASLPGAPLVDEDGTFTNGHETVFASATGENDDEGVRRFAGRRGDSKVLVEIDSSDGTTVQSQGFDLESDPGETNVVPAETYSDLLTETEAYADGRLDVQVGGEDAAAEGDIEERLEALGYK